MGRKLTLAAFAALIGVGLAVWAGATAVSAFEATEAVEPPEPAVPERECPGAGDSLEAEPQLPELCWTNFCSSSKAGWRCVLTNGTTCDEPGGCHYAFEQNPNCNPGSGPSCRKGGCT